MGLNTCCAVTQVGVEGRDELQLSKTERTCLSIWAKASWASSINDFKLIMEKDALLDLNNQLPENCHCIYWELKVTPGKNTTEETSSLMEKKPGLRPGPCLRRVDSIKDKLGQWLSTYVVEQAFHRGCRSDILHVRCLQYDSHPQQKCSYQVAMKTVLWLGSPRQEELY